MENKAPAEEMVTRQAKATEETKGGVREREIGGEREGFERERAQVSSGHFAAKGRTAMCCEF